MGKRKSLAHNGVRTTNRSASRYTDYVIPSPPFPLIRYLISQPQTAEKNCLYALVTFKEASYVWQSSQCFYTFRLFPSELTHSVRSLRTATTNASTPALVTLRTGELQISLELRSSAHTVQLVSTSSVFQERQPSHALPPTVPYAGSHC